MKLLKFYGTSVLKEIVFRPVFILGKKAKNKKKRIGVFFCDRCNVEFERHLGHIGCFGKRQFCKKTCWDAWVVEKKGTGWSKKFNYDTKNSHSSKNLDERVQKALDEIYLYAPNITDWKVLKIELRRNMCVEDLTFFSTYDFPFYVKTRILNFNEFEQKIVDKWEKMTGLVVDLSKVKIQK